MTPTLSVIIPSLNEEAVIERLLGSLQIARAQGVELILVDGGSSDNTVQRGRPLVNKLLLSSPGRAVQMNAGSRVAVGEVLWFLHADSLVDADFPAIIRTAMASTDRLWGRFDVTLSGSHPLFRVIESMINLRSRVTAIATGDQGIFIRRPLFDRLGGFQEIPLMEDIEMSARLRRHSRPICLRQSLLTSSRRWEEAGILRTVLLMWWLRLAYFFGADPVSLSRWYS